MSTATVVNVTSVCTGFPTLPDPLIPRPNFLSHLEAMFEGNEIVIIEGEEGSGKTILAAQFALRNSDNTFSFFTRGASVFSTSLEYAMAVLADQFYWYFNLVRMPESLDPAEVIRTLRLKLQRRANQTQTRYFFVIDGLLECGDPVVIRELFTNYLPLGTPGFKFLFTGPSERVPAAILNRTTYRHWSAPGFGPEEIKALLTDFGISDHAVHDIERTFAGAPGKIATIRRILLGGVSAAALDADLPRTLAGLFEIEWRAVDADDPLTRQVLGLIAHARHDLTIDELAIAAKSDHDLVNDRLARLSFIRVDPDSSTVSFVSQSFKAFAAAALNDQKKTALDRIIDLLSADGLSRSSVEHLPTYLQMAGRHSDVLAYLSASQLSGICERSGSITPVLNTLRSGVASATNLEESDEVFKFALQSDLLSSVSASSPLASEVEAHLELGHAEVALALAQRTLLKEDRLELLAMIAKHIVASGSRPDDSLLTELGQLSSDVDYGRDPERAIQVAASLLSLLPEHAIKLVERATSEHRKYPVDVALAQLSLAVHDFEKHLKERDDFSEKVAQKITDSNIRGVARTLSAMFANESIQDLLRKADELSDTKQCLYLLERWAARNVDHRDAGKVVDYALARIVRSGDYTLTADTLRRLAAPLPRVAEESPSLANKLMLMLDAQLPNVKRRGPTVDYVRLCVFLAETEAAWSSDDALKRIETLCYFIANLEGDVRCEAFAWLIRSLRRDRLKRFEAVSAEVVTTVQEAFESAVEAVLSGTAEQLEALRGTVSALADADIETAWGICARANVEARRDALYAQVISALLQRNLSNAKPADIVGSLARICDRTTRDKWTLEVLRALYVQKNQLDTPEWEGLLRRVIGIERAPWRTMGCTYAYAVSLKSSVPEIAECADVYLKQIEVGLKAINSAWSVADSAFGAATVLAQANRAAAEGFLAVGQRQRVTSVFPDDEVAGWYMFAVELTIRAFIGLLPQQLDVDASRERLRRIIAAIPSDGERIRLWAHVALRCFSSEQRELGNQIVDAEIAPILASISDSGYRNFVLVEVAAALYAAHPIATIRDLSALERTPRNDAFENICWYILRKLPANEPIERNWSTQALLKQEVDDILACLGHIDRDYTFASIAKTLCDALTSNDSGAKITAIFRAEIGRRILEIASKRLPSPVGITHDGYDVVIRALVGRLQQTNREYWERLRCDARRIPNTADCALVLGLVAEAVPKKFSELRREMVEEARPIADRIPSIFDRMGRLRALAESCVGFADDLAKRYILEAFRLCVGGDPQWVEHQRSIVDLAFRVDEDFARSLLEQFEDDPAVLRRRQEVKEQIELQKTLKSIPKSGFPAAGEAQVPDSGLGELCWKMLGGLHSGAVAYVPVPNTIRALKQASEMPLEDAGPVFAWAIENAVACHRKTPFGSSYLLKLFNACAAACELGLQVVMRSTGRSGFVVHDPDGVQQTDDRTRIGAGEREKALQIIREWLVEHQPQHLTICDAYFCPQDVTLLKIILDACPRCSVEVLCSEKKQSECGLTFPYDAAYQEAWDQICQQDPPETDIIVAGCGKSGSAPIHDRWMVCDTGALELGTSFSGLGGDSVSYIRKSGVSVARDTEADLNDYLSCRVRQHKGERIRYSRFSLPATK